MHEGKENDGGVCAHSVNISLSQLASVPVTV